VNKPGHVLTGITFFSLYQKKGFIFCHKLFPFIPLNQWENFVLYYHKHFFYSYSFIGLMLGLTLLGSIIPDIDLKFKYLYNDPDGNKHYLYHRQITHSLILWLLGFFYSVYFDNIFLFYFTLGGLSHLFGDMITGSIPVFLWGKYYNFWSRIGIDRIYKNPKFYAKAAKKLDQLMIFIAAFAIGYSFY
jgi:hypothetical protein